MHWHPVPTATTAVLAGFICGCAPLGSQPGYVQITSDPSGAEVYVMGEKTGVTPLRVEQAAVFPPAYSEDKKHLYGTVELRRTGCSNSLQRVSSTAIARGVHVKLDCGAAAGKERSPGDAQPAQTAPAAPPVAESLETRLKRVQELREKGLITEQEAAETRRRLLQDL
jgi:hypothetical protein